MKLNKATEQEFRIIQIKKSFKNYQQKNLDFSPQQENLDFSPKNSDSLSAASSKKELPNLTQILKVIKLFIGEHFKHPLL